MATIDDVINFELNECGYDRYKDPYTGTKYGRWYASVTGEDWAAQNDIAYCVMFQSYCFAMCGLDEPFFPSQNCDDVVNRAIKNGMTVPIQNAQRGDLVIFDWGDGGILDHIGLIEYIDGSTIHTIEGNTDNGKVKQRIRTFDYVQFIVRPTYTEDVSGWIYEPDVDKWWYRNADGSYLIDTWLEYDGNWYHFDSSGWMQTGFQFINGNWFYLNEKHDGTRGAMIKDTTININSSGYIEI